MDAIDIIVDIVVIIVVIVVVIIVVTIIIVIIIIINIIITIIIIIIIIIITCHFRFDIKVPSVSHALGLAAPGNIEHQLLMRLCLAGQSQPNHIY